MRKTGSTGADGLEAGSGRKRAEQVAERIEDRIIELGWPVGEIIGSESELIEENNVSRGVLREAVRLLEHHGTARMRRGPGGGLVVTPPDLQAVRRSAALYLRYRQTGIEGVVQARQALELNCLDMVGQRIKDPSVSSRLWRVLDAEVGLTTAAGSTRYLRGFHLELADLADNVAMSLFTEILMELQSEFVNDTGRAPRPDDVVMADAEASHRAHLAIYKALMSGDIDRARKHMKRHLDAISRYTFDHVQDAVH